MKTSNLSSALATIPAGRSAWSRAVHTYAIELIESLDDSADLSNETLLRKELLNGADAWQQYSEGEQRRLAKLEAINADMLNLLTAASRLDELTGENLSVYARTFAALARAAIAKATGGAA